MESLCFRHLFNMKFFIEQLGTLTLQQINLWNCSHCWLFSWCMYLYLHISMLIIDGKFFGFVKKHNYRYRFLKGHDDKDNALFKINYDVKVLQQKAELL